MIPTLKDEEHQEEFGKTVEFISKDDSEQIAYGAVMVPNTLDLQGDFERREAIESLANGFKQRADEGEALPGVMHTVFPDHVDLVYHEVEDESITLGDRDLPEGTWVQGWKFQDDELWGLVKDGILGGYSIGGTISHDIWYSPGTIPEDVRIPTEVTTMLVEAGYTVEDVGARELVDGTIAEVSSVDFPAVPEATHEEYKSAALKADEYEEYVHFLEGRGHSTEEAERLASYVFRIKGKSKDKEKSFKDRVTEKMPWNRSTETDSAGSEFEKTLAQMDPEELQKQLNDIQKTQKELNEKLEGEEESGEEKSEVEDRLDDLEQKYEDVESKLDDMTDTQKQLIESQTELVEHSKQLNESFSEIAEAKGFSQQSEKVGEPVESEDDGWKKTLGLPQEVS